jgi:hypothetical protein
VIGIDEAEQQRDGDGLHASTLQGVDEAFDLVLGQRGVNVAVRPDPLGDLEPAAAWNERGWRILEQVVKVGPRRAPQLQHIAETARGDERRARPFLFEDGVGDDCGGVRQQAHVGRRDGMAFGGDVERGHHALGQVARRGRHLGHADGAARLVDQRHIRERAADVDAYPPGHAAGSPSRSKRLCLPVLTRLAVKTAGRPC